MARIAQWDWHQLKFYLIEVSIFLAIEGERKYIEVVKKWQNEWLKQRRRKILALLVLAQRFQKETQKIAQSSNRDTGAHF